MPEPGSAVRSGCVGLAGFGACDELQTSLRMRVLLGAFEGRAGAPLCLWVWVCGSGSWFGVCGSGCEGGVQGWVDSSQLLSAEQMNQIRRDTKAYGTLPSEGAAR